MPSHLGANPRNHVKHDSCSSLENFYYYILLYDEGIYSISLLRSNNNNEGNIYTYYYYYVRLKENICCICLAITIPSKVPSRWNLWQYSPDTMHNRVLRTSFRCQKYFIRRKWFVHFQPCKSVLTRGRCGAQLALTCVSYIVIYTYPHQALIPLEMERQNGPMQLSCEQSARHWAHRIIDMNSIR